MRRDNMHKFGMDVGPAQPPLYENRLRKNDLKTAALRFLHKRCEDLRFDPEMENKEQRTRTYFGTSLKPNQIPYNMQMDINRLCLEKALEAFIDSGTAVDAYSVYYCFLEIFFGSYGHSRKMVELLSEYESNGSSLLMKHRDHYSHSVYVFALGLAIYETNFAFRKTYREYYQADIKNGPDADRQAACQFLEFWGLTALFHDIGYPFELPFEQVLSYFEVDHQDRGKGRPFPVYHAVESLTALDSTAKRHFEKLYEKRFSTMSELLAYDITEKLRDDYGFSEDYLLDVINRKPICPEDFGYYMDHAFFSSARLYRELADTLNPEKMTKNHVDALSAILLHNSLYKFAIAFYKDKDPGKRKAPLRMELHPLAWMLMLCDELQCWDRTAYGRNSRTELHPMAATFNFSRGAISALYSYDVEEQEKIDSYNAAFQAWKADKSKKEPRLKAYSDMADEGCSFSSDIERIVDLTNAPLTVTTNLCLVDRSSKHTYLSDSSFLHLYDFAVALHGRNMPKETTVEEMEQKFTALSLEYQLSTLSRAGHFAQYLDAIHCFYTDKPVDYEMVKRFGRKDTDVFAPMEHERWLREHRAMGWHHGNEYETIPLDVPKEQESTARASLREQMRRHKLVIDGQLSKTKVQAHYLSLSKADQGKDWKPFNNLLLRLKKYDGLRIYRL